MEMCFSPDAENLSEFEKLHEEVISSFEAEFFSLSTVKPYIALIDQVHEAGKKADSIKLCFLLHCFLKISEKKAVRKQYGNEILAKWFETLEVFIFGVSSNYIRMTGFIVRLLS
jgi:hypothetical protein